MTESMIERVAKAIRRRRIDLIGNSPAPMDMIEVDPFDVALARAALEAMMVPTQAMIDAFFVDNYGGGPQNFWPVMIDAALSEKGE